MTLNIGRKGWIGLGFESTYGSPVAISDYTPFTAMTIKGMDEKINNEAAYGIREKVFSSVPGKKWSEGDLEMNLDGTYIGYLLGGALGTINTSTVTGAIRSHAITRNNSNTPKSLTVTQDRGGIDRQYYPGVAIKTLEIGVADGLATVKASVIGQHPITVTSGTLTTASGTGVYSFGDTQLAFGATVAAAAAAAPLKQHDLKITIENGSEAVFRHGNLNVDTVNHKEFTVSGEVSLYFENTTDRDAYYNTSKQAAAIEFLGRGIGSGYNESLTINVYQMRIDTFDLETGLANFYAEKLKWVAEYDNVNAKSVDAVLVNTKTGY